MRSIIWPSARLIEERRDRDVRRVASVSHSHKVHLFYAAVNQLYVCRYEWVVCIISMCLHNMYMCVYGYMQEYVHEYMG
jgi:hypothetical protein